MKRQYSEAFKEALKKAYLSGKPVSELSKEFGISEVAIRSLISRMGVKRQAPPLSLSKKPRRIPSAQSYQFQDTGNLAERIADLLGVSGTLVPQPKTFTDEQLFRYMGKGFTDEQLNELKERFRIWIERSNPSHTISRDALEKLAGLDVFVREVLNSEMMDTQLAMAYSCLASPHSINLAGRQSGKDWTVSVLCLWEAVTVPQSRIVMVCGAQRQSDALMAKILSHIIRSEPLFNSIEASSREELKLKNGSFIKALPATGIIRGETATRIMVNEARDIMNEEEVYASIEPMLTTTGGPFSIFTTPLGKNGKIWDCFNSPIYLKTQIPSRFSKYVKEDFLERQKLSMSTAVYANEYEAEFLDVQSSFFSVESIQKCAKDYDLVQNKEPNRTYTIGVDWARTRDTSAIIVVSELDSEIKVEYIKEFFDVPIPDQIAYVHMLSDVFRPMKIVSEYNGLGIGPTDQLIRDGFVVEAFRPTSENKALGYDFLKSLFEKRRITIPMHPKLLSELRTLQFRISDFGKMRIHHPGEGSDDYADALMMACWPFRMGADLPLMSVNDIVNAQISALREEEGRITRKPVVPQGYAVGSLQDGTPFVYKLPTIKCQRCDRIFPTEESMRNHFRIDHEDQSQTM